MKTFKLNLHLFDGGAAASGGEGGTGTEGANGTGENTAVIYGKQNAESGKGLPAAGEEGKKAEESREEKKKRYEELINGEFKEFDTERTQNIINRRFKEMKSLEEANNKMSGVLSPLFEKYAVESGNLDALTEAIDRDSAFWEEGAQEAGMSVEAYKEHKKLMAENKQMKAKEAADKRNKEMQERLRMWDEQAHECKGLYPDFDMDAECKNPQFIGLLKRGVPVTHAYRVLHFDDITSNERAAAASEREKQVVDNIKAKGQRPPENGLTSQTGAIVKSDVHSLSKKDRAEIAKRVSRGEKIAF